MEKTKSGHADVQRLLDEYLADMDKVEDMQELKYLEKKAGQLQKAIEIMEKSMRALSDEVEGILKHFDELKTRVPQAQKQFKAFKEKSDEQRRLREGEMNELKASLSRAAALTSPQYLSAYLKLRAEAISNPLVRIKGYQCVGCNMEIPSGLVARLDGANVIICENCRRMVYK
jgi:predicted  nucleic acid-binding Zn-ribbon protein